MKTQLLSMCRLSSISLILIWLRPVGTVHSNHCLAPTRGNRCVYFADLHFAPTGGDGLCLWSKLDFGSLGRMRLACASPIPAWFRPTGMDPSLFGPRLPSAHGTISSAQSPYGRNIGTVSSIGSSLGSDRWEHMHPPSPIPAWLWPMWSIHTSPISAWLTLYKWNGE